MIGSILGALTVFGGSVVPAVIDYFKEKQQAKERTEMMTMQVDLMKTGAEIDLKKFYAMANDDEHARLIQHDIAMQEDTGFMAGLRKSVRPVITYMFFGLFCAVEGTLIWHALQSGTELVNVMNEVWDQDTQAIFAAIISFWFGSRAIEKAKKK